MGLNKDYEKKKCTKKKNEQTIYALDLRRCTDCNTKKKNPFPFPWDCIKNDLYPETNLLCNIRDMALHEQVSTIRTYISSVFPRKNKRKR